MDESPSEPIETTTETEPAPEAGRWRFVSLVPDDRREPPATVSEADARSAWVTATAPWHPALLALASGLPETEDVDYPSTAGPDEVRLITPRLGERLPSGYRTASADIGAVVIDA